MAKTSAFSYTNKTAGSNTVTPLALGLTSNYALAQDIQDQVVLNNKTAPIDAEELVAFRSRTIKDVNSNANIQYPAPVKSGIEYSLRLDEVLTTTDSSDASYRVDEPIVCTIAFRHPKSGNIGNSQIAEVFLRAISSLMKADGSWRFDDLMRSAERPIAD
jgi:hypothetical protein